MTPSTQSKLTVVALLALAAAALVGIHAYLDERGGQRELAALRCQEITRARLATPSGAVAVKTERACQVLRALAGLEAIEPRHGSVEAGQLLVARRDAAWSIALLAPGPGAPVDRCSLRRWKGGGWAVIGEFDAAPVLAALGLDGALRRVVP